MTLHPNPSQGSSFRFPRKAPETVLPELSVYACFHSWQVLKVRHHRPNQFQKQKVSRGWACRILGGRCGSGFGFWLWFRSGSRITFPYM